MLKKRGVLRKIFGPKRDTIIGDWSKLNGEEFHDILCLTKYNLDDQINKNGMCGACSMCGGGNSTYRVLVVKSEGKRQLGRPKHSWEDNIKVYTPEVNWEDVNWIYLAQDRANGRGSCERGNEPLDSIKCREFLD